MSRVIEVSEETYDLIKKQLKDCDVLDVKSFDDFVGKKLYIRTVTYHLVGRVKKVLAGKFFELEKASWIAESARFKQTIENGELNEVEPVGVAFVNIDSITDFFPINWELPTQQK